MSDSFTADASANPRREDGHTGRYESKEKDEVEDDTGEERERAESNGWSMEVEENGERKGHPVISRGRTALEKSGGRSRKKKFSTPAVASNCHPRAGTPGSFRIRKESGGASATACHSGGKHPARLRGCSWRDSVACRCRPSSEKDNAHHQRSEHAEARHLHTTPEHERQQLELLLSTWCIVKGNSRLCSRLESLAQMNLDARNPAQVHLEACMNDAHEFGCTHDVNVVKLRKQAFITAEEMLDRSQCLGAAPEAKSTGMRALLAAFTGELAHKRKGLTLNGLGGHPPLPHGT